MKNILKNIKKDTHSFSTKKGREIKIRAMESFDVNVLWNIFNDVVEERQFLPTITPVLSYREKQQWYLAFQDKKAVVLVATHDGTPIGYCSVEQNEEEASSHVGTIGLLISRGFRNEGIGKELMKKAIDLSKEIGFEKLCLSTFECNTSAVHLYEELGFVKIGLRKSQFKIGSIYFNELMMDLQLEPPQ